MPIEQLLAVGSVPIVLDLAHESLLFSRQNHELGDVSLVLSIDDGVVYDLSETVDVFDLVRVQPLLITTYVHLV